MLKSFGSFSLCKTVFPFLALAGACFCSACQGMREESDGQGELCISFVDDQYSSMRRLVSKAENALPDTNDFILDVSDATGRAIYSGKFSAAPQKLLVNPGSYTIEARSCEFDKPKFSSAQYGDTQLAIVESGKQYHVNLLCKQLNSGIRLKIAPNFLESYPNGVLFLRSKDGSLQYNYREKRIAYFKAGNVSLVLNDGFSDKTLMTRTLEKSEILTLSLSVPSSGGSSAKSQIRVNVDTSRIWSREDFVIGGTGDKGKDVENALSVSQAKANAGAKGVWVYGYIVGGDFTSRALRFEKPFKSKTNLALASKTSADKREDCLSVQLEKGKLRDELNLVEHPEFLGRKIYFKGDIVASYYGITGIVNISEYK